MNDITYDMIEDLQELLARHEYAATVEFDGEVYPKGRVVLANDKGVDSYILNMVDAFYELISNYFLSIGIEIKFNNTHSTFWSISRKSN